MRMHSNGWAAVAFIMFVTHGFAALPCMAAAAKSSVSFVGCTSDGQLGPRAAPRGKTRTVDVSPAIAGQLAFYQAAEGSGVLAPRGWHCFGTYGSNGDFLFVVPQRIDRKLVLSIGWKGFSGPVVRISDEFGGTSGRFGVAEIIARVFPAHKAFVAQVVAEGGATAADFPSGPYPHDQLRYRSGEVVEYQTPPRTEGIGTGWGLEKSDDAIRGAAILSGPADRPLLVFVSVRLPGGSEAFNRAIVRQVEREAEVKLHK